MSEVELVDPNGIEGKIELERIGILSKHKIFESEWKLSPPEGKIHFDISPLKGLSRLEYVDLSESDSRLTSSQKSVELVNTHLEQNHITDLEALRSKSIEHLNLNQNVIRDPLLGKSRYYLK